MPKILFIYLARRILIATVVVQIALTVPVVLTALFHQLPPAALRGGLVLPALFGTLPTVTYIALPMAAGVAAAVEFSRMSAEGMMAVLYSLRLSAWSICRPALACATLFAVIGYVFSCWVAPANVGAMHDVINVIRSSLNHRMLEPGRFYSFQDNQRTLYFERWETPDTATGVFLRQISPEKNTEETITAARAEFRRNEKSVVLILSNGSIQSRPPGGERVRVARFDEYALSLPLQGSQGLPTRSWKGVFELTLPKFFSYRSELLPFVPLALACQEFGRGVRAWDGKTDCRALSQASDTLRLGLPSSFRLDGPVDATSIDRVMAEWTSEATKRLTIPFLAISHTLFGIGLILTVASATGRRASAAGLVIGIIPLAHVAVLIGAETLVRLNPHLWMAIAGFVLAEMAAGIALIQRQQSEAGSFLAGRALRASPAAAA